MIWSSASSPDDIQTMNNLGSVLTGKYDIYQDVMDPKNFSKVIYNSDEWVTDAFPDDIVRTKDGSLLHAWPVERKDNPQKYIDCVALCDMTAPSYARKRISQDLSNSPYAARFLDTTTASNLRECYDKRHPMTRSQSKQARITLLNIVSNEHHLVCGSETGADYAVPVCDYFEGMMSLGPYRIKDAGRNCEQIVADVPPQITTYQLGEAYRLPLWELVYHGVVTSDCFKRVCLYCIPFAFIQIAWFIQNFIENVFAAIAITLCHLCPDFLQLIINFLC